MTLADPPPSRRALRAARMDQAETSTGRRDPAPASPETPLIDRVPSAAPLAPANDAAPAASPVPAAPPSAFPPIAPPPSAEPSAPSAVRTEEPKPAPERSDASGFKRLFGRSVEPEWTPGPKRSDPARGVAAGVGSPLAAGAKGAPAGRSTAVPDESGPLNLESLFAPTGPLDVVASPAQPDAAPAAPVAPAWIASASAAPAPVLPAPASPETPAGATPVPPDSGPLTLSALFGPTGPVDVIGSPEKPDASPAPAPIAPAPADKPALPPESGPLTLSALFGPVDAVEASDAAQPGYARSSGPSAEASVFSFTASAAPVAPPTPEAVAASLPLPDPGPLTPVEKEPDSVTTTAAPAVTAAASGIALAWVDESTITARPRTSTYLTAAASPYVPVENELLARPPRRSPLRPGVLIPTAAALALVGAYAATTLMWPLNAVQPKVESLQAQPIAAAPAAMPWPGVGAAAVDVHGIDGSVASSGDMLQMASITKIVTALLVLEELPLAPGEQGPSYRFSYSDRYDYWDYLDGGESALDVPVDESLTEYQMLQGMLIGSANNYADRLAYSIWPSNRVYADAANSWLAAHGVSGISIVEPTGIDSGNMATPEALLVLAEKALANPVIAEIVATPAVDLPGAGHVENTNGLLADPGVIGIKTGTLDSWNLLSAKNLTIGQTTVRVTASVLGQPDNDSRLAVSRALYAQLEAELQPKPSVTTGTTAGLVKTKWGEPVQVVTDADANVILWNGGTGTVTTDFSLGDARTKGDKVGTLTVAGPLDSATVEVSLTADIEGPSPWWRLTHPLDLFGLTGD
ncbi:D-alanyl-D-alanine carboxypeptidase [Microbacterium sp. BWT-B31]|uniref:D-alanyl-D-alanine carboxypeptidase family protein n=1 Tax=Microbacterium sp. BWT-B31 TaxID=3232072 RepID=UPI003529A0FB